MNHAARSRHAVQQWYLVRELSIWGKGLAISLLCLLMYTALFFWWPISSIRDRWNRPMQHGTATVTWISASGGSRYSAAPGVAVTLDVDGRVVDTIARTRLRIGENIRIAYRVGRSGRIYIEDLTP